jgi:DnaJ-class molecular chaperone
MAQDFYQTLGVQRDATPAQIQKAYRDLARKYHPDLHPDDKQAKKKFQEVQSAFDVLNDPAKRTKYDRFGNAFEGASAGPGGAPFGAGFEDVDFSQLFGARGGEGGGGGFADFLNQFRGAQGAPPGGNATRKGRGRARGGQDLNLEVEVPFNTAILGGLWPIDLARAGGPPRQVSMKVPPGCEDGAKLRLRGQGEPGPGGAAGDLLVTIRVAAHPWFSRRGIHLYVKVPISLIEAVDGAKIDIPTPRGTLTLTAPPGSSSGKKLRLKGYGISLPDKEPGDLYAEMQIVLPETVDEETRAALRRLDARHPANPRQELRW